METYSKSCFCVCVIFSFLFVVVLQDNNKHILHYVYCVCNAIRQQICKLCTNGRKCHRIFFSFLFWEIFFTSQLCPKKQNETLFKSYGFFVCLNVRNTLENYKYCSHTFFLFVTCSTLQQGREVRQLLAGRRH